MRYCAASVSRFACFVVLSSALIVSACKPKRLAQPPSAASEDDGLPATELGLTPPVLKATLVAAGEAGCATANDELHGCLRVKETGRTAADSEVLLRYSWFAPRDVSKPTVVFLHGGPGGDSSAYSGMDVFEAISRTHNVLFYDQRGSGGSSAFPKGEIPKEARLRHFFAAHHIADLESIRQDVVKEPRIVVMGHSFGAHLALAYATAHPNHVASVIALNGAADANGFVTQSTLRIRMFDRIAEATLGLVRSQRLKKKGEEGTLRAPDGSKAQSAFLALHPLLYTFNGQTQELPDALHEWSAAVEKNPADRLATGDTLSLVANTVGSLFVQQRSHRVLEDDFFPGVLPRKARTKASALSLSDTGPTAEGPVVNETANQWMVCSSLVTPRAIEKVADDFRPIPRARRGSRCREYPALASTFDVTGALSRIEGPVLLTGGTHDPLIPYALQQRDFDSLRKGKAQVSLVVFQNAGHNPDENPACFEKTVLSFLAGKLPAGRVECDAIAFTPIAPSSPSP